MKRSPDDEELKVSDLAFDVLDEDGNPIEPTESIEEMQARRRRERKKRPGP